MRNLYVVPYYDAVRFERLLDKTAIVIDALRASATMITAIQNGCARILPVENTEDAMDMYKFTEGEKLLCGESKAKKVTGFDLGNSPLEYVREMVEGKIMIYCTTNGTRAVRSTFEASKIFIGSFINAAAVAQKAVLEDRDILLACAGTNHCFSMEDTLAAGCILDEISKLTQDIQTDDLGSLALRIYRMYRANLQEPMQGIRHYENLKALGFEKDIEYCFTINSAATVPVYEEGEIVKAQD